MKLSAVVVTQNEEKNIARCLSSLAFADEVIVVDAMSEDQTVDIARNAGARVVQRKWDGFATQKQFAVEQAGGEWILLIDADEEVSTELAEEIVAVVGSDNVPSGYWIQRRNQFLGEWMLYGPWADDSQLRLFKKGHGSIAQRPVHEGVQLGEGAPGKLSGPLFHYTHQTLSESVRRMNRYTTLEAPDRVKRRRIGMFDLVVPPAFAFLEFFVVKSCWRAGVRGYLLAATTAMYRSVLYLKIFLLQEREDHRPN